jgi:hypothetical protein
LADRIPVGLTVPEPDEPGLAWMLLVIAARAVAPPVLAIVYFGVLTPISLLLRLVGKAPLRSPAGAASLWHRRAPGRERSDLTRQS